MNRTIFKRKFKTGGCTGGCTGARGRWMPVTGSVLSGMDPLRVMQNRSGWAGTAQPFAVYDPAFPTRRIDGLRRGRPWWMVRAPLRQRFKPWSVSVGGGCYADRTLPSMGGTLPHMGGMGVGRSQRQSSRQVTMVGAREQRTSFGSSSTKVGQVKEACPCAGPGVQVGCCGGDGLAVGGCPCGCAATGGRRVYLG